ncbi:50S ribosomal protein L9 [Blattabacterium cuenoti]|uniref:50S ribosomal protein L9 n=1 Tax=Blattabacterium cuenoti TaxID=1653831 RepID=UPI00163BB51F|nr:50S ribosomal protein L9 [Blattabacterium cuenoti]
MKIILKKDVENLGFKYDELDVKPGYARNYLIPKGFAIFSLPGYYKNVNNNKTLKIRYEQEYDKIAIEDKLKDLFIKIPMKVGKNGKLFGSVNNQYLTKVLNEKGISIDKNFIKIIGNKIIKKIGLYQAKIIIPSKSKQEYMLNFEIISTD